MAKATPVLWKHDPNPEGHLPIWLRFSDARRTLYSSLGVYIHSRFWNPLKRKVRKGHPNADEINALVQKRLAAVEAERIRLLTDGEPITAEALKAVLQPVKAPGDFFSFADAYVSDLRRRGQVREHRREKAVLKKFRGFTGEPLAFDRITPRLLHEYETHLIEHHGNQASTAASNFRVLKTLFHRAIREGHVAQEKNPFFQFKPRKATRSERPKLTLAKASLQHLMQRVREILKRGRGRNIRRVIEELTPVLRGWASYFSLVDVKRPLEALDQWMRRRLRCVIWRQWKRPQTRRRKLLALGLDEQRAWKSAGNGRGPWWNAGASHMNQALPRKWFDRLGLISVLDTVRWLSRSS